VAFFEAVQLVAALTLTVVLGAGSDAPPPVRPTAEAEVEAALAASAEKHPPAEVVVVLEGPNGARYRLEEATVQLDGRPLAAAFASAAGPEPKGTPVSDGDHVLSARLVYRGQALGPYPWEEGPRWALPARVTLQASRGLRIRVRLTVETNDRAPALSQRLALHAAVEPEMLVALDDAPLPPPPEPRLPPPTQEVAAPAATAPPATKKPAKARKVARSTVPAKAGSRSPAAAGSAVAASAGASESLEEATARLRSALAAPRDAGPAPVGEATR
jgi:hypothetical protein